MSISLVVAVLCCGILINAKSLENPSHSVRSEIPKEELKIRDAVAVHLTSSPDDMTQSTIADINNFSSKYHTAEKSLKNMKPKANILENLKTAAGQFDKYSNYHNKIDERIMNKKLNIPYERANSEVKDFIEKSSKLPIKTDNINKVFYSPHEIERSSAIASRDLIFQRRWPKYLESALMPALPFAEFYSNKIVPPNNVDIAINEQGSDKNSKSSESDVQSINTTKGTTSELLKDKMEPSLQEIPSPKIASSPIVKAEKEYQQESKTLSHLRTPNVQSEVNEFHQSEKPLEKSSPVQTQRQSSEPNADSSQNSDNMKIISDLTYDTNSDQSYSTKSADIGLPISEDRFLHHRSFHPSLDSESIFSPWSSSRFEPIMPFPELSGDVTSYQVKDYSSEKIMADEKRPLPFNFEQRVPETAGPMLYPQSSFENEFRVPFYEA